MRCRAYFIVRMNAEFTRQNHSLAEAEEFYSLNFIDLYSGPRRMSWCQKTENKVGADVVLLHGCPQSCMTNSAEGLFEVYEDLVEVLLELVIFLTHDLLG